VDAGDSAFAADGVDFPDSISTASAWVSARNFFFRRTVEGMRPAQKKILRVRAGRGEEFFAK